MTTENAKTVVDVVSIYTVVATIAGWLPAVAALVTIVWTTIRIFETRTVRGLRLHRRCPVKTADCSWICNPEGCERFRP